MIVQKSLFDRLRQHCEWCPDFATQLQDLSDGGVVVIPGGYPSGEPYSKKRKIPHRSELSQPEPQQPSQPSQDPRSQLPSQSSNTKRAGVKGPRKNEAADWLLLTWSAMVGRFIGRQNCSSWVCSPSSLLAKLNSRLSYYNSPSRLGFVNILRIRLCQH